MLKTHKDLEVWKLAMALCRSVYLLTEKLPDRERFGVTAQIRGSAVSVPSNIAEGYNRGSTKDYVRHLWIANGSLAELDTQLLLVQELGYCDQEDCESAVKAVESIERMLRAMIRSLEGKTRNAHK